MPSRASLTLRRRPPSRLPKAAFVILTEGQNTEVMYFKALRKAFGNPIIELRGIGGDPKTLADQALKWTNALRRSKDSYEKNDQVWVVFDRDIHKNYAASVIKCEQKGIGVARSNPCFELWLVLHLQDFDQPGDHHYLQSYFAKLCPDYDPSRGKKPDCAALMQHIADAEQRAERQLNRREAEGAPFGAPSTTVFKLIRALREHAKDKQL